MALIRSDGTDDPTGNANPTRIDPVTQRSEANKSPADRYRDTPDPAAAVPGMAPNFGAEVIPHVATMQGIVSSMSKVYKASDEALKDSYDNARFMRNDPSVMECVMQRERSVALLNWHLEAEDENDPKQKELVSELTKIIESTPRFMQYRENLQHAIWNGRYGVSQRFRWKNFGGKMRVCIDKWRPINGDKIVFRYDDGSGEYDDEQVGIRVGAGLALGASLGRGGRWTVEKLRTKVEPTDYGLAYFLTKAERPLLAIHKHYIEDGEYEDPLSAGKIHGVGIRSQIYWCWYQKQEALAFLMEYLERSSTGIEIWYYPWGSEDAKKSIEKAALERIGQGKNIILVPRPVGDEGSAYGVERIEPSMAGADALKGIIIEYFGHLIKRFILGQTLTSEAASTGLGSGVADAHIDTYMQIVRYDATNLEETITTDTVEPLKIFNFPEFSNCQVRFKIDTEAPDVESKLNAWNLAYQMGLKLKASALSDLIGSPKPETDDEVLQNPEAQQAAAASQQARQQAAAGGGGQGRPTVVGMPKGGDADKVWQDLQKQRDIERVSNALAQPAEESGDDQFAAEIERYSQSFDEQKHPRGQPGNAGEFAKTQGGPAKPAAKPAAPSPAAAPSGDVGKVFSGMHGMGREAMSKAFTESAARGQVPVAEKNSIHGKVGAMMLARGYRTPADVKKLLEVVDAADRESGEYGSGKKSPKWVASLNKHFDKAFPARAAQPSPAATAPAQPPAPQAIPFANPKTPPYSSVDTKTENVKVNPANGQIELKAPKTHAEAYAMLSAMEHILQAATKDFDSLKHLEGQNDLRYGYASLRLQHVQSQYKRVISMSRKLVPQSPGQPAKQYAADAPDAAPESEDSERKKLLTYSAERDEPFALENPKPKPKPATFEDGPAKQESLFHGMDDLPGQQKLFGDMDRGADSAAKKLFSADASTEAESASEPAHDSESDPEQVAEMAGYFADAFDTVGLCPV